LQHHDGIDIAPRYQSAIAIDRIGLKLAGRVFRQLRHRGEHGPYIKSVVQHPQCWPMPRLPSLTQPNQSNPKFHNVPPEEKKKNARVTGELAKLLFLQPSQSGGAI
jgi:hypothetical protein